MLSTSEIERTRDQFTVSNVLCSFLHEYVPYIWVLRDPRYKTWISVYLSDVTLKDRLNNSSFGPLLLFSSLPWLESQEYVPKRFPIHGKGEKERDQSLWGHDGYPEGRDTEIHLQDRSPWAPGLIYTHKIHTQRHSLWKSSSYWRISGYWL